MAKSKGFTLEIDAGKLKELLVAVRPAIPAKAVLPVLSGVLISGDESGVEFSATDLNVALTVREVGVSAEGRVLLSFARLYDIAAKMKTGVISFNETAERVTIKTGGTRYSLRKLNVDDFPAFPEIEVSQTVTIDGPFFSAAIRQVAPACAEPGKDGGKPFVTGVGWFVKDGTLAMLGSDSYVMQVKSLPVTSDGEIQATVPAASLMMLAGLLNGGDVTVGLGTMQARFSSDRCVLVTRLIEQKYPDWRGKLPSTFAYGFSAPRESLIDAIERADVVGDRGDMKLRTAIRISGEETVILSSKPKDGDESEVELDEKWEGEFSPEITGVNPDWLLSVLKSRVEPRVLVRFVSPQHPISVSGDDSGEAQIDPTHVTWVMPRQLV